MTTAPTLLIKDADCVATMDDAGTEWRQASVLIQGPRIVACGPTADLDPALLAQATDVIDARGHVVHAPAPADAMERDKQQRLEDARARAAARSADYRARQQRVSALHSEWRAGMPANVTTQTASLSARQHEDAQMPAQEQCSRA